ncbi:MAG: TRL-like family protein [Crocinitomicaceae bacterium]|jgi:hypothetical protein|nr:TRL-like family protein [Crocinitomicaceae bacterium]
MKNLVLRGVLALGLLVSVASCTLVLPVTAANAPIGNKVGKSTSTVLFGTLYLNQKYGLGEAIKKGKITSAIAVIDEETTDYILFQKKTLIIYAE